MSTDSAPEQTETPWTHARHGIRNALGLPSLMLMATMLGVGGICRDIGFPMGAGILSTLLMWAAPAQLVLFGSIAAGIALPAAAAAVSLSSIRFVPMAMSILPMLRGPGVPTWKLVIAVHFVAVTAWVEGMRALPGMKPEARLPYYYGFASTVLLAACIATGIGYHLVGAVPAPLAAGLLFTSPVFFTLSLVANARKLIDWLAIILGFAAAPLSAWYAPDGLELLVGGVGAGTLAYLVHRVRARAA